LDEEMKSKVVDVVMKSDRVIVVKLIFEEKVLNVDKEDKEVFWREVNEVMQEIPSNEDVAIGVDMNGHVCNDRRGYKRIHGRYSFF